MTSQLEDLWDHPPDVSDVFQTSDPESGSALIDDLLVHDEFRSREMMDADVWIDYWNNHKPDHNLFIDQLDRQSKVEVEIRRDSNMVSLYESGRAATTFHVSFDRASMSLRRELIRTFL